MDGVELFQHVLLAPSNEDTIFAAWRIQDEDALLPDTWFDETLASWSMLHIYGKEQMFCWPLHSNPERASFRLSHCKPIHCKVFFVLHDFKYLVFDIVSELDKGFLSSIPLALALRLFEYESRSHCQTVYTIKSLCKELASKAELTGL